MRMPSCTGFSITTPSAGARTAMRRCALPVLRRRAISSSGTSSARSRCSEAAASAPDRHAPCRHDRAAHARGDEIFFFGGDKIGRVDFGEHLSAFHRIAGRGDSEMLDPAADFRRHRRQAPLIELQSAGRAHGAGEGRAHHHFLGAHAERLHAARADAHRAAASPASSA